MSTSSFFTRHKPKPQEIPPFYEHQLRTNELLAREPRVMDLSDPGTAKTRPAIHAHLERVHTGNKRCLVFAPKSILQPAWGNEIDKFFPGASYMCAYASNRKGAFFDHSSDFVITNHDAARWLANPKNIPKEFWRDFDSIIVDESTAYKNHGSQRSKAVYSLAQMMEFRELMTGTINPRSIMDVWHQAKIIDDGVRLGNNYWKFRGQVQTPHQIGPRPEHKEWRDKEGVEFAVFDLLADISIRHEFEKCNDIPKNRVTEYVIDLPPKLRRQYQDMMKMAALMLKDGSLLTATNAASVHQKLMQIASGAVYAEPGKYAVLDNQRAELVMDLIEEREQCVVAFNWRHQRIELEAAAKKREFSYAIIDGSINDTDRIKAVDGFQDGTLRVLFTHPKSAGHGLTLTRGTTTIWTSPTYNAEHYKQLNHRIYRAGQTRKTETIHIVGRNTIDEAVYKNLSLKLSSMQLLLDLMETAQ